MDEIKIIKAMDFDFVIIAILNEKIAEDIKTSLISMGICDEKILYITRKNLLEIIEAENEI